MVSTVAERLKRVANQRTVTITHYGRKSGKPYVVTIWFMVEGDKVYLTTADINRQWVKNVRKSPHIKLAIGDDVFEGEARFLEKPDERNHALALLRRKYPISAPMMAAGQLLGRIGIMKYNLGAFEVTLLNEFAPTLQDNHQDTLS